MGKNWKQAWAVLLLAFMQCFAPLLHAHPGGDSASHGVHFHGEMALHASDGAVLSLPRLAHDETAIGAAQEFKQDYSIQAGEPLLAATQSLLPGRLERRNDVPPAPSSPCVSLCYILPLAQAPPAA